MQLNRVKVPTSVAVTGGAALTFGTPPSGFVGVSGYEGMGGIPYCLTWGSGKFEIGIGSVTSGAFTRIVHENDIGTTAAQDIPSGAILTVGPIAQSSIAYGGSYGLSGPTANGGGAIAVGGGATAASNAVSIGPNSSAGMGCVAIGSSAAVVWSDNTCSGIAIGSLASAGAGGIAIGNGTGAGGEHSIVISSLSAGSNASAPDSIVIGNTYATFPGQISIGNFGDSLNYFRWKSDTPDATPTVAAPLYQPPSKLTVPEGELWYVKARVIGTVFNEGYVPTQIIVRSLTGLVCATGLLGAVTEATEFTYGASTATATMTATSGGVIQIILTGIESTQVQWSISLETHFSLDMNY